MKKKCFTLIELMMVVVIIGVIASLAIPKFKKASSSARKKEALRILKHIYNLEDAFYMEKGTYQISTGNNVIPDIGFIIPSSTRRYNYTAIPGNTGDILTSLYIVATEIEDADIDGIYYEEIIIDENGIFHGDYEH